MRHFGNSIARALPLGLIALGLILVTASARAHHPVDIANAALVAKGKTLYADNCAACHGKNLTGPENPKDFKRLPPRLDARVGHASHHDDMFIFNQITRGSLDKNGKPIADGMPAFAEILKPGEIWAVLTYIKSRWPEKVYRMQHRRNPGHGMGMGGGHGGH